MDAGYANLEGAYVILETPILKGSYVPDSIVLFPPTDGRRQFGAASAIASAEAL
jgi:hypothetical protein